jgi:4-hydroxybenzoate polyprenyltransferase
LSGGAEGIGRRGLASRFWEYQAERFPFFQHGLLIVTFTFSAASYSRICRGAEGFIPLSHFIVGAITSFLLFFLLRVFDEFKDAEEDARYRPYRPVPRGLISLRELAWIGVATVLLQLVLNGAVIPRMIPVYLVPLGYMGLMSREFFVRDWLKRHPIAYMLSHMVVMPAIDFYTTGLDWVNAGVAPPNGLQYFLLLTFLNGIVIEVGRKIRSPEGEETGVETYSALYGSRNATIGWLGVLLLTYGSATLAAFYAGFGPAGFTALTGFLLLCALPALRFLRTGRRLHAGTIETAAGVWTIGMYLTLGAAPMLLKAFR